MTRDSRRLIAGGAGLLAVLLVVAPGLHAQSSPRCDAESYHRLDFWVGSWDVTLTADARVLAGTNVIEKTLGGCALIEHWTDTRGGAGKSLFYYHPADRVWKQVWVTDAGSVKEKVSQPQPAPGAVRFQGELRGANGATVLDRTTLTSRPDGTVRQHIEQSIDQGLTWQTTFDAIYSKRR